MDEYEPINSPEDHPKGKFANRSLARTIALQVLYQKDLNPDSAEKFIADFLRKELPDHKPIRDFAQTLIDGTLQKRAEIDATLEQATKNWSIVRMSATDRNVLRLAIYELQFTSTPRAVVIDEAVELAKRFGTADSAGFVNGVLGSV